MTTTLSMMNRSLQAHDAGDHAAPDLGVLRERAFNLRWATVDADVIPLTAADPDLPVAREVMDAIASYIGSPHLPYGPACGLPSFREAVASHFGRTKSAPIAPGRVVAANAAASAITLVAQHLLREGDEVVVQDPVDFLVTESARRAGADIRHWKRSNGRFTVDGLRAALTPRTRLVSVCHPHNPTGSLWSPGEVEEIAGVAAERGVPILSDEVWSDVVLDGAQHASFAAFPRNWVVYGLSKGYGLAGLRIGAVIAPDEAEASRFAAERGFEQTIEGASTLSQIAAVAALELASPWRERFLEHCACMRDLAATRLARLPGVCVPALPTATFVLFVDIRATGLAEEEIASRIERIARVRVVPGLPRWFGSGAAGHIRLSLATSHAILDDALGRIERAWPEITA